MFCVLKVTLIITKKNIKINNLSNLKNDKSNFVFHAGTKTDGKNIFSIGGRVLNFVNISDNLKISRNNIIKRIEKLNWKKGFFRKDIGFKVIDK